MFSMKRQWNWQFSIKMAMKMSPNQNSPSVDTAILDNFAQVLKTYNLIKDERRNLWFTTHLSKLWLRQFCRISDSLIYGTDAEADSLTWCRCTTGRVCVSPGLFYDGECQVGGSRLRFCLFLLFSCKRDINLNTWMKVETMGVVWVQPKIIE